MACDICGRNGCVASFHSIEEQERHETKMQLVDQIEQCPDCEAWYIDHDGFGCCGCKEHERIDAEQKARIKELEQQLQEHPNEQE